MTEQPPTTRRPRGRPPATPEQRHEVRMRISRAAVDLFTARGFEATKVEDIADAAGVSVRTLWRHFDTKAGCIKPVVAANVGLATGLLAAWDGTGSLSEHLSGLPQVDLPEPIAPRVIALAHLTREPALGQVWLEVHREAEDALAAAMAERSGQPADSLQVRTRAAMLNAALRVAGEWTADAHPDTTTDDELRQAVRTGFADLGF